MTFLFGGAEHDAPSRTASIAPPPFARWRGDSIQPLNTCRGKRERGREGGGKRFSGDSIAKTGRDHGFHSSFVIHLFQLSKSLDTLSIYTQHTHKLRPILQSYPQLATQATSPNTPSSTPQQSVEKKTAHAHTMAEEAPKMQYRHLGRSGLQVSAISLGGWLTYGGHVGNESTYSCMKAAYDVGINFFDCAEGYAGGESERVMGEAIKKYKWKRNDLVISTKINWGAANGDNPVNNGGLSRKHLIEGTNAALERLQLDYVDLLYAHRPDRNTPMEETVRAFNHLIDTGKCFYWGTSEWQADEIERAHHVASRLGLIAPVMEQPQYNMLAREKVEKEFQLLYENYGLGLTPFSPLKVGDMRMTAQLIVC